MDTLAKKMVYDLFTGKKLEGDLHHAFPIGRAIMFPGNEYYVLKLWPLYNQTYYLAKNLTDHLRYTIFAKKIEEEGGPKFQNPIGAGWFGNDLTSYLEIKFRYPRQSIYMSLFPLAS